MTAPLSVAQRTAIWNEIHELLSNHYMDREVTMTTSSGRTYTIASKYQDENSKWIMVSKFPLTGGVCELCNKGHCGRWVSVWHGDDSVLITSRMFHHYINHEDDLPEFKQPYAEVFLK
jgi:hypothetical protein